MADSNTLELLRRTAFFKGVDEKHLQELATRCTVVEFPPRTTVFEEFDPAEDVYFIVEGSVSIGICGVTGCRQISVLHNGELLGWSPLIGRTRLFDTARTESAVKTLVFKPEVLLSYCKSHPEFGFDFMRRAATVLGHRLSATRQQLLELSGIHLPHFALESD